LDAPNPCDISQKRLTEVISNSFRQYQILDTTLLFENVAQARVAQGAIGRNTMAVLKILSTAAILGLMVSPAFAADCPAPKSGFVFSERGVTGSSNSTNTTTVPVSRTYQGYSQEPQHSPDGQGTSTLSGDLNTTTVTTNTTTADIYRKPGASGTPTCNEETTSTSNSTTELENISAEGPGRSPALDILGDRTEDLW
jgi:hypothetical protein